MTLLNYSQTHFLRDLQLLNCKVPGTNHILDYRILHINPSTKFFGGLEWENMQDDLSQIIVENRKYFCVCLFTMVCTDENMYANFKGDYESFNTITNYPKFGWLGFGINFEKPCYILTRPIEVDFESISELEIKDFIQYQITISSRFLGNITPVEFFTSMINDIDFNCESEIFRKILSSIKSILKI
jgi:hypothetical protein